MLKRTLIHIELFQDAPRGCFIFWQTPGCWYDANTGKVTHQVGHNFSIGIFGWKMRIKEEPRYAGFRWYKTAERPCEMLRRKLGALFGKNKEA